jgi:hypothetical protein
MKLRLTETKSNWGRKIITHILVKVKLRITSLPIHHSQTVKFTLEQAMKFQRERYSSTLSLTSALDEGGWSTPRPGRFTPRE